MNTPTSFGVYGRGFRARSRVHILETEPMGFKTAVVRRDEQEIAWLDHDLIGSPLLRFREYDLRIRLGSAPV